METKNLITKILEITEDSPDGWKYLQFFRSQPREKFALIYPNPETFLESWNLLFHDLKVLYELDLYPILVLNSSLPGYIRTFLRSEWEKEIPALPIRLIRKPQDFLARIQSVIHENRIPVILEDEVSEERIFDRLSDLVELIRCNKLILLNQKAGIRRKTDAVRYSIINLSKDYGEIMDSGELDTQDCLLLSRIRAITQKLSHRRFTVSVTSPVSLLKELFTVKGSGTLVKRGSRILIHEGSFHLNQVRLQELIESSFQKKCKPGFIEAGFHRVILEADYKACALFRETPRGILLSKFAVDEIARGEGVGREIWDKMKEIYPQVFWRARRKNSISNWYMKEADGMIRNGEWIYFWIGEAPEKIPAILDYLKNLEEDLWSSSSNGNPQ